MEARRSRWKAVVRMGDIVTLKDMETQETLPPRTLSSDSEIPPVYQKCLGRRVEALVEYQGYAYRVIRIQRRIDGLLMSLQ